MTWIWFISWSITINDIGLQEEKNMRGKGDEKYYIKENAGILCLQRFGLIVSIDEAGSSSSALKFL